MVRPGVLVISHGSRDPEWVALVDEAVAAIRCPAEMPVFSSFLEIVEGRLIQDGIDALEAQGVTEMFVLPLFVSSGSTHVDDIGQAFGRPPAAGRAGELEPFRVRRAKVTVGRPIDDDPVIAELLLDNVRELSREPGRETLLLIAHGSREKGLNRVWRSGMRQLAERVRALGGFARAEIATLLPDQAACVMRALTRRGGSAAASDGAGGALRRSEGAAAAAAAGAASGAERGSAASGERREREAEPGRDSARGADAALRAGGRGAEPLVSASGRADGASEVGSAGEGAAVLVAPLFLSRGYFTQTVIPSRLEGFSYRYNGRALLPNGYLSRWMEGQIEEWLGKMGERRL